MKIDIRHSWPLVVAIALTWAGLWIFYAQCCKDTGGHLIYPIDDTYIHMAMAKNLSQHGIWGVSYDHFTSTSSSPMWTLILAGVFAIVGPVETVPFLSNVIVATLMLCTLHVLLRHYGVVPWAELAIIVLVAYATPFLVMALLGMEHLLHAMFTLLFMYIASIILSRPDTSSGLGSWKILTGLCVVGLLLTASRYEGLFLILIVAVLLTIKKRIVPATAVVAAGLLPAVIYGVISVAKGWHFVPSSVLLKAASPLSVHLFDRFVYTFYVLTDSTGGNKTPNGTHLLVLLMAAAFLFVTRYDKAAGLWRRDSLLLFMFIAMVLFHVRFARMGWFFRYEAYLVAAGVFVLSVCTYGLLAGNGSELRERAFIARNAVIALLVITCMAPLVQRSNAAVSLAPKACKNIHGQQYQMGRFLNRFYTGKTVAMMDVGAAGFLADINIVDLGGLASFDIGTASRRRLFNDSMLEDISRTMRPAIAVVNWPSFVGLSRYPDDWVLIGEWTLSNNVICTGARVFFYAIDPAEQAVLAANLKAFSSELPADAACSLE